MKFGILVNEGPFNHQAPTSPTSSPSAALDKGHEIYRVFFYYDGVLNGNNTRAPSLRPMIATSSPELVRSWPSRTMSIWRCASLRGCGGESPKKSRARVSHFRPRATDRVRHPGRPHRLSSAIEGVQQMSE